MIFGWLQRRRRRRLLAEPFPEAWLELLATNLWQYACLTPPEQTRLRDMLRIMVAEKNWEGCRGQEMSDEIRVTIAAQVALLLLGLDPDSLDGVLSVLVYPDAYLAREIETNTMGVVVEQDQPREGEAWPGGPVILSWADSLEGGCSPNDGRNLVVHEFSHQLDMLNGRSADGIPPMPSNAAAAQWSQVLQAGYDQLLEDCRRRRPTLLDCYGTKNMAEMFAVSSEVFFQNPWSLERVHPDLYAALRGYYGQDPARWNRQNLRFS